MENESKSENTLEISDLPPEILEKILLYLPNNDKLVARLVSKYWMSIVVSSPRLNLTLYLVNCRLEKELISLLLQTELTFARIVFEECEIAEVADDQTEFWSKIGKNVKEIYIKSRHTRLDLAIDKGLKAAHFPKLKSLKLDMLPLFYELSSRGQHEWIKLLLQIENFTVHYLQNREVTKDVSILMPKVKNLRIDGCKNKTIQVLFNRVIFSEVQNLTIIFVSYQNLNLQKIFRTNFDGTLLRTLFLSQFYSWIDINFNLISEFFPNLEVLGIGIITKYQEHGSELKHKEIAEKLFKKPPLKELHFVTFRQTDDKKFKSFVRTDKGIEETNKKFRAFDEIQSLLQN
ncbi:uncharacterized protein LOC134830521 [Culicoides brevitarsis]|uniref:uncharacterized protein LOC134830521 n=1 Tax=Culicoides brevitarsis TaxID=469753 RepID=UPI00307C0F14